MRARSIFRVILYGKCREFFVPHAFKAAVVEIDMGQLDFIRVKAFQINAETMILRCYLNTACFQVLNRLIRTTMAEF